MSEDDVPPGTGTDDRPRPATGGRLLPGGVLAQCRYLLEYVTFGYGVHHLLRVVLLQFAVLFLDVGLLAYTRRVAGPDRPWLLTVTWLAASVVFLVVLATLVRQLGRRSFTPRFHRPLHLAGSVVGYLLVSGLSFALGYLVFVLPGREARIPPLAGLLPGWLLVVVFATFLAIGYHAQVAVTDHPTGAVVTDAVLAWLASLSWVDAEPDSLAREADYQAFVERTAELSSLLAHARTAEARRLEADFREWRERFEARSMLSRRLIVVGGDDGVTESERLAAEHERFADLRRRLVTIAEVEEPG